LEQVGELLETIVSNDEESLRNLSIFYYLNGTLDEALAEVEERPREWRRHAWLLRAQGRLEESAIVGERAGDPLWVDRLRASQGDALAFIRVMDTLGDESFEKLAFSLARHRLLGNAD